MFVGFMPFAVSAAEKPSCSVSFANVTCRVSEYNESKGTLKIKLAGTESEETKVKVKIMEKGETKALYTSKYLKVKKGEWKVSVSKKLSEKNYDMNIAGESGTLTIGKNIQQSSNSSSAKLSPSSTTLSVSFVPLLSGGTALAGGRVPVSYLKVVNTGKETATLQGFWMRQNGTAPVSVITGFSTVDDKGGSRGLNGGVEGSTPFNKNGLAFAPTDAVFVPGQMRLFTIMALISNNIPSSAGTELKIDVDSIQTNATSVQGTFPIKGTTWGIAR